MEKFNLNVNSLKFWEKVENLSHDLSSDAVLRKNFETDMLGILRQYQIDMDIPITPDGKETIKLSSAIESMSSDEKASFKNALMTTPLRSKKEALRLARLNPDEIKTQEFIAKLEQLAANLDSDSALAKRFADDPLPVLLEKNIDVEFFSETDGKKTSFLTVVQSAELDARRLLGSYISEARISAAGLDRMAINIAIAYNFCAVWDDVAVVETKVLITRREVVTSGYGFDDRPVIFDRDAYTWSIRSELSANFARTALSSKLTALGLNQVRQQELLKEAVIQQISAANNRAIIRKAEIPERVVAEYEYKGLRFQVDADVQANSIKIINAEIL